MVYIGRLSLKGQLGVYLHHKDEITGRCGLALQEIVSLQSFIVGVNHFCIAPQTPTCKSYPIAILVHDHCVIHALPPKTPFLNRTPHTIGDGNIV